MTHPLIAGLWIWSSFGCWGGLLPLPASDGGILSPLALEVNTVISAIQLCRKQGQVDDFICLFVHSNTLRSWNEMVAGTRFCGGTGVELGPWGTLWGSFLILYFNPVSSQLQRSLESAS